MSAAAPVAGGDTAEALGDPVAALGEWVTLKERVAAEATPLIEAERALRKRLFAHYFPDPKEGTNTVPMANQWELKATYPIDRTIDPGALEGLSKATVGASLALLEQLKQNVHPGTALDLPICEFMRIPLGALVKWVPEVNIRPYRTLTDEQRTVFDMCLLAKPGSISMSLGLPAKAVKAVGKPGAGL